jgi:hypothetical protein
VSNHPSKNNKRSFLSHVSLQAVTASVPSLPYITTSSSEHVIRRDQTQLSMSNWQHTHKVLVTTNSIDPNYITKYHSRKISIKHASLTKITSPSLHFQGPTPGPERVL